MSAFNVVRFRVKPGKDGEFLAAHAAGKVAWPGLKSGSIIKTGDASYCLICAWSDTEAIAKARPAMIATLDGFRHLLVPTSTGVTDAVSGPVVLTLA